MLQLFISLLLVSLGSARFDLQCERRNTNYNQTPTILLSEREKLVPTKYNFSMIVDARDNLVSRLISETGMWDHKSVLPIASLLSKGDTFLNLGTQSGIEAILAGKLIGPTGRLYLFEPYSFSYKIMRKNVYLNGLQAYTQTFNVAAGDQQTNATIVVEFGNTGGSNVIINSTIQYSGASRKYGSELQVVLVDRVDDVLPEDVRIDFALIDVERMEVEALLGMERLLERSPTAILAVEWQFFQNPRKSEAKLKALVEMMKRLQRRAFKYLQHPNSCKLGKFVNVDIEYDELQSIRQEQIYFTPMNITLK